MKRVIVIHRWDGSSQDDWRPWLKGAMEKLGYTVLAPEMPDTSAPRIESWVETIAKVVGTPDTDTYFVGHSIGCQAILRYLATLGNLKHVKEVLPHATLLLSDNDPYGCFEENRRRFSEVVTKQIVVANAGHFTEQDGYRTLPDVVTELQAMVAL